MPRQTFVTRGLAAWVAEIANLTQPERIHWADGSQAEYDRLCAEMVASGMFVKLNPERRPNSYLARSDPTDVARVEDRTFICSRARKMPAPPTTGKTRRPCAPRCAACSMAACEGRTMYVIPFSMGPLGSAHRAHRRRDLGQPLCRGQHAHHDAHGQRRCLSVLGTDGRFVPCLHSVGAPLAPGQKDVRWPCNRDDQVHRAFPGNARDLVLRLGLRRQRAARQEVLRAAHRLHHGPRRGLAGRAHADPRRRESAGREDLRGGGLSVGLRQDQLRHADSAARPSTAGRSRPSATTSPGSSRARTAGSTPSIPRRASSAWRREPRRRPTPTRWPR